MKKVIVTGILVATVVIALPIRAQVVDKDDVIVQLVQTLVGMTSSLISNLQGQTDRTNALEARIAALEGNRSYGAVVAPAQVSFPSQTDLDAAANLRNSYEFGDRRTLQGTCSSESVRRGYDRIFDLMCAQGGF